MATSQKKIFTGKLFKIPGDEDEEFENVLLLFRFGLLIGATPTIASDADEVDFTPFHDLISLVRF